MDGNKKYLLSTRPLPKGIVEEAAAANVIIEELSFITTNSIQDYALFEKIKAFAVEQRTVVFTSMNAVEAVAAHLQAPPQWDIYSIGNTTRTLIEEKWGKERIAATAENAQRLGERLIDDGVKDVLFFCGNVRRDELPNKVRSEGGKVEEVVVYQTEEIPVKLAKHYDGILFFSPSAVNAFYGQNKPDKKTTLYAIGNTTAEALRQQKAKNVVVGRTTAKVDLARLAVAHLTKPAE